MLNKLTTLNSYLQQVLVLLLLSILCNPIHAQTHDEYVAELTGTERIKAELEKTRLEKAKLDKTEQKKVQLEAAAALRAEQEKRERNTLYKLIEQQIAFAKELNVFVESDNRLTYISEGDESSLQAIYDRLAIRRDDAERFARRNSKVLSTLPALSTYDSNEDYASFEQAWWTYQQRLESTIDKFRQTLGEQTQSSINKAINTIHKLDALGTTVVDLQIGALLTKRADLQTMSEVALNKFMAIPSPIAAQEDMRQREMKHAKFPQALYRDVKLEALFKKAFEATGWHEKVVKVHLKEKKWKPSFNSVNRFIGDTMAAWVGVQDKNGDGKVYDFRILTSGEHIDAIRFSHEMAGWILVDNIR